MHSHKRSDAPPIPVIVAGLSLNGASVLRGLVQAGYDAIGLSFDRGELGWHVRGARCYETPDPTRDLDGWVARVHTIADRCAVTPALLPMSDVHVVALDRAATALEGYVSTHGFGIGLRTALTSKRQTFELAAKHDFPRPASEWITSRDELAAFAERVAGPVLVKPDLTYQWRRGEAAEVSGTRKVIDGPDVDALLRAYDEIAPYTPALLAQELIPGPDDRLVYWSGFMGPEGRVGGRLVGRKHRVVPIHRGSATYVRLVDAPEIEDRCERFLAELGYRGLCGIELKEDPRDGVAKLIEINPRCSLWDDIGVPVGVDLAQEAVRSLHGEPTVPARPRHFRQKWVELTRDLPAAIQYRREGLLTMTGWLATLSPPIVVNDLPVLRDPGYAAHVVGRRLAKLLRRVSPSRTELSEVPGVARVG